MSEIVAPFRRLPQLERFVQRGEFVPWIERLSRPLVLDECRQLFALVRQQQLQPSDEQQLVELAISRCQQLTQQRLQPLINATGTVLHTNLGRAPIDPEVWQAVTAINTSYNNLELQLSNGKRGQRFGLLPSLLAQLTGAETGMVVNNNAASLFLLFHEVARGKEVVVSRGEQIQIGGGFRIPDILALSGATLVEVGTTNVTTAQDYLNAITDNTAMVLMVHQSNFAIQGFTEKADMAEVARHLPSEVLLVVDQGSGLIDEEFARSEHPVGRYLRQGADLVCFSGDKILGGPQAGILVGKQSLIARLNKNPLMRTYRPSKVILSLLEELLVRRLNRHHSGGGIAAQSVQRLTELRQHADWLQQQLPQRLLPVPMAAVIGGGTLPLWQRDSVALGLISDLPAQRLLGLLRQLPVPIVAVIHEQQVVLNLATILPGQLPLLAEQLAQLFASLESPDA